MTKKKFYIYAHTIASHGGPRPFGEIFYIGQGCGERAYKKSKSDRTEYWHRIVKKYGFNIHIFESGLTKEEANISEKRYIKAIGRADKKEGTLINFTNGGDGQNGRVCSTQTKNKMKLRALGNSNGSGNKGRAHLDEMKIFSFINKDGVIIEGKNLSKFAKDNNYSTGNLSLVLSGKRKSHKGLQKYIEK